MYETCERQTLTQFKRIQLYIMSSSSTSINSRMYHGHRLKDYSGWLLYVQNTFEMPFNIHRELKGYHIRETWNAPFVLFPIWVCVIHHLFKMLYLKLTDDKNSLCSILKKCMNIRLAFLNNHTYKQCHMTKYYMIIFL